MSFIDTHITHPLHDDEVATLKAMQDSTTELLPTHCINSDNLLEGFVQRVDCDVMGSALSIHRNMFFGHSLFECTSQDDVINKDVVRLLGNDNRSLMRDLLRKIETKGKGLEASFQCIPENIDAITGSHGNYAKISYARGKRAVDSKHWEPEIPNTVGLYHAMVRGYQKDSRHQKLFIGVSGGCARCCDSFYNLMLDVGNEWTALDVAHSEEVWWLRKACQRMRCSIASTVAETFDLKIQKHLDVHSYDVSYIGLPCTDVVEHDIVLKNRKVCLYNACSDTTNANNGILCQMNPSEGYWLFKGAPKSSSRITSFGSLFGMSSGLFPTRSSLYVPGYGNPSYVRAHDSSIVVRHTSKPRTKGESTVFQCFDENFMRKLEQMGWNRDHGVVELVPIIVGCT
jgi:hypothetical protein